MSKRESYHQKISFDPGRLAPGTRVTVWDHSGLGRGYGTKVNRVWFASVGGIAVPGYYDSEDAAVYAALHLSSQEILDKLEGVYGPTGLTRPVTMEDLLYVRKELAA